MDIIIGTIFEIFQYGSLLCAFLIIYFSIKRTLLNKQWLFDVPLLLLMIHGIVYYCFLFGTRLHIFPPPNGIFFTPWSTALRFHGYATLLIIAIGNYLRERRKIWRH